MRFLGYRGVLSGYRTKGKWEWGNKSKGNSGNWKRKRRNPELGKGKMETDSQHERNYNAIMIFVFALPFPFSRVVLLSVSIFLGFPFLGNDFWFPFFLFSYFRFPFSVSLFAAERLSAVCWCLMFNVISPDIWWQCTCINPRGIFHTYAKRDRDLSYLSSSGLSLF